MKLSIRGLQEAQRGMLKAMAAVRPEGGLERAVHQGATQAHRHTVYITHVDTGALRSSHVIDRESPARYRIYLSPSASNPRTGARTSVYGVAEHKRGGDHAFYERTYRSGHEILARSAVYLARSLP